MDCQFYYLSTFIFFMLVVFPTTVGAFRWKHLAGDSQLLGCSEDLQSMVVERLPKFELHAHLHGSIRHSTILDFLKTEIEMEKMKSLSDFNGGIELSAELRQWLEAEKRVLQWTLQYSDHGNANKPFDIFPIVHKIIKRKDQLQRILREMIIDYSRQNTVYLEIRTTPRILADGTTMKEYVELLVKEVYNHNLKLKKGFEKTDQNANSTNPYSSMLVKLILSVDRGRKSNEAFEIIELAHTLAYYPVGILTPEREKVIVGIDFSGNPQGGRFQDFENVFIAARNMGFNLTIHAAEMKDLSIIGQGEKEDETSFILDCRPDRLGHMLYLNEKHFSQLSQLLTKGKPPLIEICPSTSFYLMGLRSFADHPHIRRLQSLHYPYSLNTDDSGIFNTTITQEIFHMKNAIQLSILDIAQTQATSLSYIFASNAEEINMVKTMFRTNMEQIMGDFPLCGLENLHGYDGVDISSFYTL